jgi:hypothetical protein
MKIAVFWVVATQKTAIFILTAVKTSNPTKRFIIRVLKSRKMKWVERVARIGAMRNK